MKRLASKLLILCCLIGGSLSNTHAQTFVKRQGAATDISISPSNGNVYVIGTSRNVFLYNVLQKRFYQFKDRKNNFVMVSETTGGLTCALDGSGTVYTPRNSGNTNQWMRLATGGPVQRLTTGKDGEIYGLSSSGNRIMKVKGGRWEIVNHIPPINGIKKIAVHNDYYLLVITNDNSTYEYVNRTWRRLPGKAIDITYDKKRATYYKVALSKEIFKWNAGIKKWEILTGTRNDFAVVAAYDGNIWGTTTQKEIYEYNRNVQSVSRPTFSYTNYAGTYKVSVTRMFGTIPGHDFNGRIDVYMTAQRGIIPGIDSENIRPLNGRFNLIINEPQRRLRIVEIPPEDPRNFIYISSSGPAEQFTERPFEYAYSFSDLGEREFKLEGKNANAHAFITFRFQLKKAYLNTAKEEKVSLKISEIEYGKEYFFVGDESDNTGICFKIEKL